METGLKSSVPRVRNSKKNYSTCMPEMRRRRRLEKAILRSMDKLDKVLRNRGLPVDEAILHETAVDNTFDLKGLNVSLPSVSKEEPHHDDFRKEMSLKLNVLKGAVDVPPVVQDFRRSPVKLSSYTSKLGTALAMVSPDLSASNRLPPFSDNISQRNAKNIKCASFQPLLNRSGRRMPIRSMRNVSEETMDEEEKAIFGTLQKWADQRSDAKVRDCIRLINDERDYCNKMYGENCLKIEMPDSDIEQSQISPNRDSGEERITNFQSSSENQEVKLGEPVRRLNMMNSEREETYEEIGEAACVSSSAMPLASLKLVKDGVKLIKETICRRQRLEQLRNGNEMVPDIRSSSVSMDSSDLDEHISE